MGILAFVMTIHCLPSGCDVVEPATGSIQCSRSFGVEECSLLDAYLERHPQAYLRIFKSYGSSWNFDLGFLAHLPSLRHLDIDANAGDLNDLSPLELVTDKLVSLSLDTVSAYSNKKLDKAKVNTQVLTRFKELDSLQVCGRINRIDFIPSGSRIRTLSLWRTKLTSLDGIQEAKALEELDLHWTGSLSLEPVGGFRQLSSLEIWDSRNLRDIRHIAGSASLQRVWILSCGKDFTMCDADGLDSLRVAVIHSSAGSRNIEILAKAPGLKCLVVSNSPDRLAYSDFRPLFDHPTLCEIRADNVENGVLEALGKDHGWTVSPYPNFPADEYLGR